MKSATVSFGDRSYNVEALPIRQARVWRQHLEERMGGALTAFREVGALAARDFKNPDELFVGVANTALQYVGDLISTAIRLPDLVTESVLDFSTALAKERKWIETHATDEEMTRAFIAILGLAYPFGSWAELIQSLGLWARTMRTNSAGPSSESGPTSSAQKNEPD
jgi:hypothetical protein